MKNRQATSGQYPGTTARIAKKTMKINISTTNIRLRPKTSERPPSVTAPIRMPKRVAAPTIPPWPASRWNWRAISGNAMPVMNTTSPSKNFPAAASDQISHCMPAIGVDAIGVPSGHVGRISI